MARKKQYRVECAEVRRMVPLEKILDRYGVLAGLKRAGSQLAGCCPIHNGSNRKQFVVNLDENSWRWFGDCGRGAGTLELVAEIEPVDITEAAVRGKLLRLVPTKCSARTARSGRGGACRDAGTVAQPPRRRYSLRSGSRHPRPRPHWNCKLFPSIF